MKNGRARLRAALLVLGSGAAGLGVSALAVTLV
jgi:hypothetical protein